MTALIAAMRSRGSSEESKDAAPQLWQKFLQGLFRGNEAGTMRVGYLPNALVETVGGGSDAMTEALQGLSRAPEASNGKAGAAAAAPKSNAAFSGPRGRVAPAANVVVMVDAAAEEPVKPNIHLAAGADLVGYSGGKCLRMDSIEGGDPLHNRIANAGRDGGNQNQH